MVKVGRIEFQSYDEALEVIKVSVLEKGVVSYINEIFDYLREFTKFWTLEDELDKLCSWINKALSPVGLGINAFVRHKVLKDIVNANYIYINLGI